MVTTILGSFGRQMRKTISGDQFPKFKLKCFLSRIKDLKTGERGLFFTLDSQGFLSTSFPSSPYLADFLSLCLPRSDSVKIYTLSGEWETILLESNCARTSFFKVKLKHPTGGTRRKTQFWQEGGFNDITTWAEHGSKRMRMLLCDSSCVHKQLFANTLAISTLLGDNNVFTASCRMHFRPS